MSKTTELLTAMLNDEPIEDFTPRSRIEAYLKNCCLACGCDGLPEPITETDKLLFALAEKVAGGGGGEIVPLTVTENGTYTPPEGVDGYSPVEVMVAPEAGDIDKLIDGSITEVISNVETVRDYAFAYSTLKKANFPKAKRLKQYAFYKCSELAELNFPEVTYIYGNVFSNNQGANKVESASFPKLKTAESQAFKQWSSIKILDLGQLDTIPYSGFSSDYNLRAILLRGEKLCFMGTTNAFSWCYHYDGTVDSTYNPDGLKDGYIYVPASLVDSYKTATNWVTFADQFRALEDYTVDGTITGELDPAKTGVTV